MEYTILGETGLEVSVAGLGCGGPSRLGQAYGNARSGGMTKQTLMTDRPLHQGNIF